MTSTAEGQASQDEGRRRDVWTVFAVTWAIAVLFHLAGNTRLAPEWGRAGLGLAAVALLARPRSGRLAAALAVAVLVNVWLEAPLLSNHWLLHGLVAAIVLGGVLVTRGASCGVVLRQIAGPLRLLLVAFYAFAAFAKLNTDFVDPAVSCGVFYLEESARSWGLGALVEGWSSAAQRALAVTVAAIELTIPLLLLARRSRSIGVVVALLFHFVLALDRTHQFFDFSSALVPLFLLFFPADAISGALDRFRSLVMRFRSRWPSGPELLRLAALAAAALVVVIAAGPGDWPAPPLLQDVGVWAWLAYGIGTIAFGFVATRTAGHPEPLLPPGSSRALLLVPALAVLNGISPYVELKTGASWNMYSNLAVVDGDSNHLVVRRGLPLTRAHGRLVDIVAADNVDLDFYIDSDWQLPEVMLTDHLAGQLTAVVVGRVDGQEVRYEGASVEARPEWQRKFQVFRSVDGEGAVGCQPSFGPAR